MDTLAIKIFLAALPVILILLYVYQKDKNKEPLRLLLLFFVLGIVSCFVVLIVSKVMKCFFPFMQGTLEDKTFVEVLLYAFIGVALIEEFCKWLMLYLGGYKNKEFDEVYDILVYAVFVSLGFAFFENIMYILKTNSILTALLRAVSAIPGHACDAVFMGYYLSMAKEYSLKGMVKTEKKSILLSIIIPSIIHGIYDFCLMSGNTLFILIFFIFIIFLYSISIKKLKELSSYNKKLQNKNEYCRSCGAQVTEDYCPNCGIRQ